MDRPFVGADANYDFGGSRLDRYCDHCGLLPAWCSCPPHVVVSVNGQPIEPVECPKDTGVILGKQGTMEVRVSSTVAGVPAAEPEPRSCCPGSSDGRACGCTAGPSVPPPVPRCLGCESNPQRPGSDFCSDACELEDVERRLKSAEERDELADRRTELHILMRADGSPRDLGEAIHAALLEQQPGGALDPKREPCPGPYSEACGSCPGAKR